MDLYILISALSVMHSWVFSTALPAPSGEQPSAPAATPGRHVRTKRCSCATFLDKECVYFCHLDIIWVNTPERVVSYGMGDAPRTRRALPDSMATGGGRRCQCSRENDSACRSFCRLRSGSSSGCAEAPCRQQQAGGSGRTERTRSSSRQRLRPLAARAALNTRLLLAKRARQRHRARAWEGESTAS